MVLNVSRDKVAVGAIDLGGTKIEASLFDANFEYMAKYRVETPKERYVDLKSALIGQIDLLLEQDPKLPVGISHPGHYNPKKRRLKTANLPVGDEDIVKDIEAHFGRAFTWENDCKCFAYSEAIGGAGTFKQNVVGLIMGTGLAAGHVIHQKFPPSLNNSAIEIGHVGAAARLVEAHNLPLFPCGCGRIGCIEAYVSGTGVENIAAHRLGARLDARALLAQNDAETAAIFNIWYDFAAELLDQIQVNFDTEMIVLGGGLSLIPSLTHELRSRLEARKLTDWNIPEIVTAKYGDASGVRGAAILAYQHHYEYGTGK